MNVAANYGATVNYSGTGTTSGRQNFIQTTADLRSARSPSRRIPKTVPSPSPDRGYTYVPAVGGGLAFMYHLTVDGVRVTDLRLSGEVVTKIFTGQITNWSGVRNGLVTTDR